MCNISLWNAVEYRYTVAELYNNNKYLKIILKYSTWVNTLSTPGYKLNENSPWKSFNSILYSMEFVVQKNTLSFIFFT